MLLFITVNFNELSSQSLKERKPLNENLIKNNLNREKRNADQEVLKSQINDLNKQIVELSKTVADTKQSFYDSKLNLWNFILTGLGILIAVIGYFGYKSISGKINDLKGDNDRAILKGEDSIKDIKNDLLQRITEVKNDFRDFKTEHLRLFDKFEKEANDKMDKGLGSALQQAIDKIMKDSFVKEMEGISEQVSELRKQFENFSSNSIDNKNSDSEMKDDLSGETKGATKPIKNAFDDDDK